MQNFDKFIISFLINENYGNILTQVTINWYLTKLFEYFILIAYNFIVENH